LSRLTRAAPLAYNFKDEDKHSYLLPTISQNTPGDVITAALNEMWEGLNDGNQVALMTRFRCVGEEYHQLLAH
jgi:hypothetical protein